MNWKDLPNSELLRKKVKIDKHKIDYNNLYPITT